MTLESNQADLRKRLIDHGIESTEVLDALFSIPREQFVPSVMQEYAYDNRALSIGHDQTISQPYIVARMTELLDLQSDEVVLDVGTGSGYQAAVLSRLCRQVISIERLPELSDSAGERLAKLGIDNVTLHVGDGSLGWSAHAPYDGILVAAAAPSLPEALTVQLAEGGRLVVPIGDEELQELTLVARQQDTIKAHRGAACRFVKLIGEEGWDGHNVID